MAVAQRHAATRMQTTLRRRRFRPYNLAWLGARRGLALGPVAIGLPGPWRACATPLHGMLELRNANQPSNIASDKRWAFTRFTLVQVEREPTSDAAAGSVRPRPPALPAYRRLNKSIRKNGEILFL